MGLATPEGYRRLVGSGTGEKSNTITGEDGFLIE
jgi:hypothetical protein